MIINGREIAEAVLASLEAQRPLLGRPVALGILMAGGDASTESFIRIKSRAAARLGIDIVRRELEPEATTEDALEALADLASRVQGVIVQLPLHAGIDAEKVIAAIPQALDVDALGPKPHLVVAPVAGAMREILKVAEVDVRGKKAVVVGAGRLVGKPSAELLTLMGANVAFITEDAGSLEQLKSADIAMLGAGNSGFIKPGMLNPGIVLIDAGTSEAAGGKVMGDADPSCANMASVFTPVPGGIGPVAIAMIFKNLFELVQHHEKK